MFEHKTKDLTGSVVTLKMDSMAEIAGKVGVDDGKDIVLENPMQVNVTQEDEGKIGIVLSSLMLCNPELESARIPREKVLAITEARPDIAAAVGRFKKNMEASATWVGTGSPAGEADEAGE